MEFDPDRAYHLHPKVALRRRLSMLRAPELVELVESLGDHLSVRDALASSSIDQRRWPSFERALASLAASEVLVMV